MTRSDLRWAVYTLSENACFMTALCFCPRFTIAFPVFLIGILFGLIARAKDKPEPKP